MMVLSHTLGDRMQSGKVARREQGYGRPWDQGRGGVDPSAGTLEMVEKNEMSGSGKRLFP